MKHRFYLFSAFIIFAAGAQVNAQDAQFTGQMPRPGWGPGRRSLVFDIDARVLEKNNTNEKEVVIWEEHTKKTSIPGSPVGIKLVGSNVVVAVQFTPFLRRGSQNVLVAQGQIWLEDPNYGLRYYTSIQTIPFNFGEPLYFFPLGPSEQLDASSIEIVLTVDLTENKNTEAQKEPAVNPENEK